MTQQIENPESAWFDPEFQTGFAQSGPGDKGPIVADSEEDPEPVPPPVQNNEPEITKYPDGSQVTVQKGAKGWEAILESGTGRGAEKFYGATKNELLSNVLAAKLNATKQIRKPTREIKLAPASEPPNAATPKPGTLSANEVFEIKTQLESNPDLALDSWFQKKTGMSVQQLVDLANEGKAAKEQLRIESEARSFRNNHPEYLATDENLETIEKWFKKKFGAVYGPHWTAENLEKAFEDLVEDELLELANPEAEPTPAPPPPVTPAAQPTGDPRIVRTTRRTRASNGLRESDSSINPSAPRNEPSAEEVKQGLENATDEEITKAFEAVRRARAQSAQR